MKYREAAPGDYEDVRRFLYATGWEHRVADSAMFERLMERTSRTVVALDGERVVGFARALCDDVSNGYISMVAVAVDKRGQGIGRELVRQIVREDEGITWVLRAGRDSKGFWERMGFKPSEIMMERTRN